MESEALGYIGSLPTGWLLTAFGCTIASYAALVGYDLLALRHVHHRLPCRTAARTSLIAFGISNTMGQVWLSGDAARYRLYRAAGLSPGEIARVVAFVSLSFWLGYVAVAAAQFPFAPPGISPSLRLGIPTQALWWTCLALLAAYLLWCRTGRGMGGLSPPELPLALGQVGLATLRTMLTAAVLYAWLAGAGVGYLEALGLFVFAVGVASLGQVPGAAGVLEAVVVLSLAPPLPVASLLGALVLFRLLYYLLPLTLAVTAFVILETAGRRRRKPSKPS